MLKSIFLPFRCNPIGRWDKTWSHWLIPDYEREILSFKARNHTLLGPWMIRFISLSCWNMKLLYYNFKNVLKYANEAENLHFTTRLFIKNVHPCTFSKFYGQNVKVKTTQDIKGEIPDHPRRLFIFQQENLYPGAILHCFIITFTMI